MPPAHLPDNALVVRFAPTSHTEVALSATEMMALNGRYSLSVWASAIPLGESDDQVVSFLVAAAGLGGIALARNKWCYWCRAGVLSGRGFAFGKEGWDGEPEHHYAVTIDSGKGLLRQLSVCEFLAAFAKKSRVS